MAIVWIENHVGVANKVAGTAVPFPVAASSVPAGNTLIAAVSFDNLSGTTPTISASAGWVQIGRIQGANTSAGADVHTELWGRVVMADINSGASLGSFTLSSSVTATAAVVMEFSGLSLATRSATVTSNSSVTPGAQSTGDLVIGAVGGESNAAPGSATTNGWTTTNMLSAVSSGGSAATNVGIKIQYTINSGSAVGAYAPTKTDGGVIAAVLQPTEIVTVNLSDSGTHSRSETATAAPYYPPTPATVVSTTATPVNSTKTKTLSGIETQPGDLVLMFLGVQSGIVLSDYPTVSSYSGMDSISYVTEEGVDIIWPMIMVWKGIATGTSVSTSYFYVSGTVEFQGVTVVLRNHSGVGNTSSNFEWFVPDYATMETPSTIIGMTGVSTVDSFAPYSEVHDEDVGSESSFGRWSDTSRDTYGYQSSPNDATSLAVEVLGTQPASSTPTDVTESANWSAVESMSLSISKAVSVSDAGNISHSESVQILTSSPVSDIGNVSTSEARTVTSSSTRNDSGTISTSESATVVSFVSRADSGSSSVIDALSPTVTVPVSDAATATVNESLTLFIVRDMTDSGTISTLESASIYSIGTLADSGTVTAFESSTVSSVLTTGDSGAVSVIDGASVSVPYSEKLGADAGSTGASESISILVTTTLLDTVNFSVTESSSGFYSIGLSDSSTISMTETIERNINHSLFDVASHSAVEFSSVIVNDGKAFSDSGSRSVSESVLIFGSATSSDSGNVSAFESVTVAKSILLSDSGTLTAVDSSSVFITRPMTESANHSIAESGQIVIFGTVDYSVNDSGIYSAIDGTSGVKAGVSLSESATRSVVESISRASESSRSDVSAFSAVDSLSVVVKSSGSDFGNVSIAETSSVEVFEGSQITVYAWNGTQMVESSGLKIWDGTKFITPTTKVWTGAGWL